MVFVNHQNLRSGEIKVRVELKFTSLVCVNNILWDEILLLK